MKLATVVFASATFLFFTLTVVPPYLSSGGNTEWIDFANTVFKLLNSRTFNGWPDYINYIK